MRLCAYQLGLPLTGWGRKNVSVSVCLGLFVCGEAAVGSAFCTDRVFSLSVRAAHARRFESDSLLLALRRSEQSHKLYAASIKAHLSVSQIRKGG